MTEVNRQIRLASRPVGFPTISDFYLAYSPLPVLVAGEVLVRSLYLSLDPWMRGRMSADGAGATPVAIGGVMVGGAAGYVVESADPAFRPGDAVQGKLGWQEYAVVPASALRQLDLERAAISTALGVLGIPGLTAYFGVLEICRPEPGETFVVSVANGGVGMLAGQVARIRGSRVVGVAGASGAPGVGAKIAWLCEELGFDAVTHSGELAELTLTLGEICPAGIDSYFDNAGGTVTDAVFQHLNARSRIAVCGQNSQDNLLEPELAERWLDRLIVKEATVEGFLVSTYADRFPAALEQLAVWLESGQLRYREDVAQGIEAAPQAFIGMLEGRNLGKQLVQLAAA